MNLSNKTYLLNYDLTTSAPDILGGARMTQIYPNLMEQINMIACFGQTCGWYDPDWLQHTKKSS